MRRFARRVSGILSRSMPLSSFPIISMRSEQCPRVTQNFATRWRLIKSTFSRKLALGEPVSPSRAGKGERGIWQRRYWEHTIRDERDFARHIDYIHINPVKHGLVKRVCDWQPSSFHRFVKLGIYPVDWAGEASNEGANFGERREPEGN